MLTALILKFERKGKTTHMTSSLPACRSGCEFWFLILILIPFLFAIYNNTLSKQEEKNDGL
jgi:hypothetical protein